MTTSTLPAASAPAPTDPGRPGGPNGWLVIGGVLTVTLIVLGALSVAGWLGYRTETQTESYRTPGLRTIAVDIDAGDLTVLPGAGDTVDVTRRLRYAYERPTIDERWDGQALHVSTDCRITWVGPGCAVDYTLTIPAEVEVRASTSTGDITVRNILGKLELSTSTGDISVLGARHVVSLHTSTGDINAVDLASDEARASTSTGDITLRFVSSPSSVVASTGTGDLTIVLPEEQAYHVVAETSTGDIDVDVRREDTADRAISARTSTGDIEIRYW